ncbi:diphosphomevalonate decarboxylase [Pseudovirgaria hyperparasitica]|uniref:Diphosphomevalonate decarboxylase n=1 Tax=Pseudovirgaria hyperparasitica TaxID=470096 RepID=A0A6A6WBV3_9PEZI|nr:diphosphomevalonate decarboxylase [Pseudovirgaria hyperparasitica]KAF2759440.1 diphosphomevalonate decarboxylase [Pseudovirgaria hyperparasitica]
MTDQKIYRASTTAPVNIAVIKYWGKRDAKLNLPTNSSLSVTLAQNDLRTHTTASCSAKYPAEDVLVLNGAPQDVTGARTQACFRELRALRKDLESKDSSLPPLSSYPLKIVSENNFPTAAGLASSAAGFAALVRAIANLYELPSNPTDLSRIARQGSGSACRSLFGGYAAWEMGTKDDGSDSVAYEVAPASHWPEMRACILVVSAEKKGVSSTTGMQTTVATSTLFAERARDTVPKRMKEMTEAIQKKDFEAFARLTMKDSNSFHATCLDTEPPIFYLNDVSRAAITAVNAINQAAGKIIAAYTFDAGPNAVVYYLQKDEKEVAGAFKALLESKDGWAGERGAAVEVNSTGAANFDEKSAGALQNGISRVILTGVGEGPIKIDEHLIDENGEPVHK